MIKFYSIVKKVERKKRTVRGYMAADGKAHFDSEDLGWYLLLDGSWEYLHVGDEKPDFTVGQRVVVTIDGC
jgi:hypothetical protein